MSSSSPVPPDADLARLRAADPAAGTEVDLAALRAAVDARRAAPDGATPGGAAAESAPDGTSSGSAGASGGTDELARARARRLQWPARVAVAAAAALVVGVGGGYALGAAGGGSDYYSVADAADAGASEESASGAAEGGAGPEGMIEGPRAGTAGAAGDAALWAPGGRTVFTGASLGNATASATAWALDAPAAFTEDRVTQVATALGLEDVRLEDGVWRAGGEPGQGPVLDVQPDGLTSTSFYDPATDPWACGADELTDDGACAERDLGPAPAPAQAEADTVELLTAIGLTAADLAVTSESPDGVWVHVTAEIQVDGRPSGLQWSATWTGGGLQSLYGPLAPLTELGEYDVVSPAEAVERLSDPRFGADGGMAIPYAAARGAEADAVAPSIEPDAPTGLVLPERPSGEPPTPLAPGAAVPWPVTTVELVGARLVLAVHHGSDGAAALLPTYELADAAGSTWRVLALDEQHLDLSGGR
ncbi:hypothetical protein GXB85_14730 [Cellulomonas sp. APG4]|uniref:hypothetical protein n=1 Tax=Cellulomonas sp. APG4 TaxID=1538656 RepID=UPI00137B6A56|nr:hypothetical protein [Cellulomonas sp. APG4]NCT92197.1 hypothetical protein [Cellulomonas sp. APG4]